MRLVRLVRGSGGGSAPATALGGTDSTRFVTVFAAASKRCPMRPLRGAKGIC